MAIAIVCRITPKLDLSRVDTLAVGVDADAIALELPAATVGARVIPYLARTLTLTKAGVVVYALAASTPINLDLTALASTAGFKGDADLTSTGCKLVYVANNEAVGSGRVLTVGGEGSAAEYHAFIGQVVGDKVDIPPGTERIFYTREAGFGAVGVRKLIRLDPGSNPVNATIAVGG